MSLKHAIAAYFSFERRMSCLLHGFFFFFFFPFYTRDIMPRPRDQDICIWDLEWMALLGEEKVGEKTYNLFIEENFLY